MYHYGFGPGYGMMGYGIGFGLFGLISGLLHLLFWIVVIVLVVRFLRRRRMWGDRRHIWMHGSALDILKERYAKGEIDKAEFEAKKKDLEA